MIYIKNTQRSIKLDIPAIKDDVKRILELIEYADFDISIWFTTNATIRTYNKDYRHKDKPTDVISFPYHEHVMPGVRIVAHTDDDKNLGDILVSPVYIQDNLSDWNQTLEERIRILLVHSICHLLGYDHMVDEDYEVMQKEEDRILNALKKHVFS